MNVQRTHRCPAVGNAAGAVPGADGLRVCRAAVHAAEGIPGGVEAVHRAVCPEHGVVVAALAVLGLVVDDAALYLYLTGGVVALEVGAVVHGIPQAELHIAEQIQLLDNGAAVAHCHPVQLTGIPLWGRTAPAGRSHRPFCPPEWCSPDRGGSCNCPAGSWWAASPGSIRFRHP